MARTKERGLFTSHVHVDPESRAYEQKTKELVGMQHARFIDQKMIEMLTSYFICSVRHRSEAKGTGNGEVQTAVPRQAG